VIGALRCKNIYDGISASEINVDQLMRVSKEQVESLEHTFKGNALKDKVEQFISQNQKKI
jgi:hypothetical protein